MKLNLSVSMMSVLFCVAFFMLPVSVVFLRWMDPITMIQEPSRAIYRIEKWMPPKFKSTVCPSHPTIVSRTKYHPNETKREEKQSTIPSPHPKFQTSPFIYHILINRPPKSSKQPSRVNGVYCGLFYKYTCERSAQRIQKGLLRRRESEISDLGQGLSLRLP